MNIERFRITADHLEKNVTDEQFSLTVSLTVCGTLGCVAGHVVWLFGKMKIRPEWLCNDKRDEYAWYPIQLLACQILGIRHYPSSSNFWLFQKDKWPEPCKRLAEEIGDRRACVRMMRLMADSEILSARQFGKIKMATLRGN